MTAGERQPWFVNVRVHHHDPAGTREPSVTAVDGWSAKTWRYRFRYQARDMAAKLAEGDLPMLQQAIGRWAPRVNVTHAEITWGSTGAGGKIHGRIEVRA